MHTVLRSEPSLPQTCQLNSQLLVPILRCMFPWRGCGSHSEPHCPQFFLPKCKWPWVLCQAASRIHTSARAEPSPRVPVRCQASGKHHTHPSRHVSWVTSFLKTSMGSQTEVTPPASGSLLYFIQTLWQRAGLIYLGVDPAVGM